MPPPVNAYQRSDVSNEFEDISDIISDVSPEEVPFQTGTGSPSVDNTFYQFDSDELDAADGTNARIDGDTFAGQVVTPPKRVGNHCQISSKEFIITRRARKINKSGQRDELARQTTRKGRELRRDMETILLSNQASLGDDGAVAPLLGGLPSWIVGDVDGRADRGAGGSDGGFAAGLTVAATDGTVRALSEQGLLDVVTAIFKVSKLKPMVLQLGAVAKGKFSTYMFGSSARIATQYQDQGSSPRGGVQVVGAVDTWVTDYAVMDVVPNLWQREEDGFFLNYETLDVGFFDPISTDAMAKVADTDDRMILVDYTLIPRNEKALGIYADIDETLPMVA